MEYLASLISGDFLGWKDIAVRVTVAVIVGVMIGIERELSYHPAGMKTHVLVCLGAAITSMISAEMSYQLLGDEFLAMGAKVDISRIASGVVSGIGFIGAGAIIKSKDGSMVTGITTAATVWVCGCMGLAIGMGYFRIIIISMIAILFTTIMLKIVENKFIKQRGIRFIEVATDNKVAALPTLEDYFERKQILITFFDCSAESDRTEEEDERKHGNFKYYCRYYLRIPKTIPFNSVMRDIAQMENVSEVYEIRFATTIKKQKG